MRTQRQKSHLPVPLTSACPHMSYAENFVWVESTDVLKVRFPTKLLGLDGKMPLLRIFTWNRAHAHTWEANQKLKKAAAGMESGRSCPGTGLAGGKEWSLRTTTWSLVFTVTTETLEVSLPSTQPAKCCLKFRGSTTPSAASLHFQGWRGGGDGQSEAIWNGLGKNLSEECLDQDGLGAHLWSTVLTMLTAVRRHSIQCVRVVKTNSSMHTCVHFSLLSTVDVMWLAVLSTCWLYFSAMRGCHLGIMR